MRARARRHSPMTRFLVHPLPPRMLRPTCDAMILPLGAFPDKCKVGRRPVDTCSATVRGGSAARLPCGLQLWKADCRRYSPAGWLAGQQAPTFGTCSNPFGDRCKNLSTFENTGRHEPSEVTVASSSELIDPGEKRPSGLEPAERHDRTTASACAGSLACSPAAPKRRVCLKPMAPGTLASCTW
jgi:hypothetical protein